ncbi:MAG: sigma-70 family RNA polymerase sigma factor, partial [Schwartzia sp.]|nr:sigma-70 family RNA polymerase sigma factor [Schwartzia sp. (in: firmicutes)]
MKLSEKESESLWKEFGKTRAKELRDRLVENYLPLVNVIAGRIAVSLPSHVDRDDLISSGFFGLLDAVERYDLKRQNKFETYAGVRIRGAMLDYLRSKDWIPLSVRQKIRAYEKCVGELEGTLGRSATDEEIADAMGLSNEDFEKVVSQINVATVIPLDDYMRAETAINAAPSPQETIEKQERQQLLA